MVEVNCDGPVLENRMSTCIIEQRFALFMASIILSSLSSQNVSAPSHAIHPLRGVG